MIKEKVTRDEYTLQTPEMKEKIRTGMHIYAQPHIGVHVHSHTGKTRKRIHSGSRGISKGMKEALD